MYIIQNVEMLAVFFPKNLTLCQLFAICCYNCWNAHVVKLFSKNCPRNIFV